MAGIVEEGPVSARMMLTPRSWLKLLVGTTLASALVGMIEEPGDASLAASKFAFVSTVSRLYNVRVQLI